jgi:PhoH-like ATPase
MGFSIHQTYGECLMRKAVILDTSVLIHDPQSVRAFPDDVVVLIPIFVIMELDVLKDSKREGASNVAHLARQASKIILELQQEQKVEVISHEGEVNIKVLDQASKIRYVDLLILQTAIQYNSTYDLTLYSNDVNLRIIAQTANIKSAEFVSEVNGGLLNAIGLKEFTPDHYLSAQLVQSYWQGPVRAPLDFNESFHENQYVTFLDNNQKTHLFQYKDDTFFPVEKQNARTEKAKPRNMEQMAALDLLLDPDVELVALLGKAGTGKTFLALASALEQKNHYQKILISKPVVDVGKGIGFLPGSLGEKMEPWMQSFFDNLDQIDPMWDTSPWGMEQGTKETFLEKCRIEIQPIHSIRGRSLKQSFMIIDEAQNLTKHEIKSIITRAAEGTKVVLLGDPHQIDHPYLNDKSNGLVYVLEKMMGQSIFGCMTLHKSERSSLSDIAADLL